MINLVNNVYKNFFGTLMVLFFILMTGSLGIVWNVGGLVLVALLLVLVLFVIFIDDLESAKWN